MNNSDNSSGPVFDKPFKVDPLVLTAMPYLSESGDRLLDVGCGEGADSVFFAEQGFRVVSFDNNPEYLDRLNSYLSLNPQLSVSVYHTDVIDYNYPANHFDVVNCLLVGCCMTKSEFERMLLSLKRTLTTDGIIIMSLRNYLDPQYEEYIATEPMVENNTFRKKEDCCQMRYYIEKDRLRKLFSDYSILHYFEGMVPDKYEEIEHHGDSQIIARKFCS